MIISISKYRIKKALDGMRGQVVFRDGCTDRIFRVREISDGKYFVSEAKPTGGFIESAVKRVRDEEFSADIIHNPNGLKDTLLRHGRDEASMVRSYGGYSQNSIYYYSIDSIASAISCALQDNKWFRHAQTQEEMQANLGHEELLRQTLAEEEGTLDYWRKEIQSATIFANEPPEGSLLKLLKHDEKRTLQAFLNRQSVKAWQACESITPMGGLKTLGQLWQQHLKAIRKLTSAELQFAEVPTPAGLFAVWATDICQHYTALERELEKATIRTNQARNELEEYLGTARSTSPKPKLLVQAFNKPQRGD